MPTSQLDDDGYELIVHEPKLSRLDKARLKLDQLSEKHERLSAIADPSPDELRMLAIVGASLGHARQRYKLENERAADDIARLWEARDEWRASEEGRPIRNLSRRKVRAHPNANLKDMTDAEKEQHRRDQKADSKWKASRRDKGWSEDQIQAAFAIRLQEREAERRRPATVALENLPGYGTF